jgi:hypothetical protein
LKIPCPKFIRGQYFMFINNQYANIEWLWASRGWNIVVKMMVIFGEIKKKTQVHSICGHIVILKTCQYMQDHWQILKAWNRFLIFWRWKTFRTNINLTPLVGIWFKTCITLSLSLPKLLCTRHYYNSWSFRSSFLLKKYPKMIGYKKTTLSIWTSYFDHVLHDWVVKLDIVILIGRVTNEMIDYSISR